MSDSYLQRVFEANLAKIKETQKEIITVILFLLTPLVAVLPQFYSMSIEAESLPKYEAKYQRLEEADRYQGRPKSTLLKTPEAKLKRMKEIADLMSAREQVDHAKTIVIPLGGKTSIVVSRVFAPALWSLTALGLLFYLCHRRATILRTLEHALKAILNEPGLPEDACKELLGSFPFWIAPFSSDLGLLAVHRERLGWRKQEVMGTAAAGLVLSIAIASGVFVVWTSISIREYLATNIFQESVTFIPVISFAAMAYCFYWWFWGSHRFLAVEAIPSKRIYLRRQVLAPIATVGFAVATYPAIKMVVSKLEKTLGERGRNARHRSKTSKNEKEYYFPTGNTLHYQARGRRVFGCSTAPGNAGKIGRDAIYGWNAQKVHLECSAHWFEDAALHYVESKEYQKACDILLIGIRRSLQEGYGCHHKVANLRHMDLLAGVSLRFHLKGFQEVQALARVVKKNLDRQLDDLKNRLPINALAALPPGLLSWKLGYRRRQRKAGRSSMIVKPSKISSLSIQIESRLVKWQNPSSGWYQKWVDTKRHIKWTGLLM